MTIDELKRRDVINVRDASNYGNPCDFCIDVCNGHITDILVSPSSGMFSFSKEDELVIPWCAVVRVGDGAILVDIPPVQPKCDTCSTCERHGKKRFPFFRNAGKA